MRKTDRFVFDSLPEEMMAKSNVFGSFVMDRIFGERNGTSVVVHDGERFVAKTKLKIIKRKPQIACRAASADAMYSASVVDKAKVG